MNDELIKKLKKELIETGRLLWDKDLATGINGNISARVEKEFILLSANKSSLGFLKDEDLVLMDLGGQVIEGGQPSTEKLMHTEVYRHFPEIQAVLHTHPTFTNGYFSSQKTLTPLTFETRMYLGELNAIEQVTPTVTETKPVLEALKLNNIAILRHHGAVSIGKNLFDCFVLIQGLEEAIKVDVVNRLYRSGKDSSNKEASKAQVESGAQKRYKLFSQEQIDEIVRLVNEDKHLKELGEKTQMTMDLAVKLNESGRIYSFKFKNGRIVEVGHDENAEFLISAPESVWRAVFNREIDPFVATTQKKMNLRGDFAKISKWYAPCNRIFELWQQIPVES